MIVANNDNKILDECEYPQKKERERERDDNFVFKQTRSKK